ncbi:DUF4396 domain-containing protein [Roseospira marina]|uniref:DUF4396 domain-containing protein n=1 Tax=Roseospira marina TaxID=140057 RepID=A0A5M6IF56_9PROT|nr:DUF4396 domain-containing protein [Roseospira marina]KAA5606198.1 DUF4396 domain-containing protein [Roseospira marina]MBB4314344.1 uncharacterized membrane protein YqaE (UPF0057 family) [Roseospira marina]MBB5087504.1 uncharacterized membrane protein YqaE (UPF0057 family) [Roseospira marina]
MIPLWLHTLSIVCLVLGALGAIVIALDERRDPQHMWIMNVVWPVVALFAPFVAVWAYFRYGKLATHRAMHHAMQHDQPMPSKTQTPFPVMVGKGTAHCGAGCTLGDILAEWLAVLVPSVAVWFGWTTLFAEKMFAVWVLDYVFALLFGIAFQYFTIKPMRNLSVGQGLVQALKADVLSLTAWQVGMYGFMAIAQFALFRALLGVPLEVPTPEFWFMMQLAMWCGFATAYPVNRWLVKTGVKEQM